MWRLATIRGDVMRCSENVNTFTRHLEDSGPRARKASQGSLVHWRVAEATSSVEMVNANEWGGTHLRRVVWFARSNVCGRCAATRRVM